VHRREKVLYASGRLEGTAADWWDAYTAAHDNPDTINWQEFRSRFREQHIPKGLMKHKKQEFLALKQGTMSVSEYRDKFIQLSCYAPADIADDEEKQDHFREGLIGPIKYQLMVHTFDSFQKMVDKAIRWSMLARKWVSRRESTSHRRSPVAIHVLASTLRREHLSAQGDRM
jgi:hypothetical protein